MTELTPINILMVEDSDDDTELTAVAFRSERVLQHFHRVRHGAEALDYLHRRPPFEDATLPELILLDLHMPVMGGEEFLRRMKASEELRDIPVIVFTASEEERDRVSMLGLGATHFASKPMDLRQYMNLVRQITSMWIAGVHPPAA